MTDEQPKDELIGKNLGQFEILQEIGRGGMATVYKSRQQSMNRIVAVKVLPQHLLHDPGFYERFEREVEVISTLEHPHILPIYDYGQSDGVPYIAMRFLGGGSLEDQIRRQGPVMVDDLERPLRQIAQALDYAHKQGIIHRDLKPGNIMLDEGGNAYLSDFGIARVMGSEMTGSMIIGTPSYMSPEQANGLPIDARADVYALGVVLFELITGRLPFQAETPMAVLLKHINEDVPPIADFREDVSVVVEEVVRKATAKDPDDRFSSAGDMALAFSAALRDETAAGQSTNNYVHYWINGGVKAGSFMSIGAHFEELFLSGGATNGGGDLERTDGYRWLGPYLQFAKDNAGLRFSFGGDLTDDEDSFSMSDFYKMSFFMSF